MTGARRACARCLARGWLLVQLGGALDYACRDRDRMMDLLALADTQLLQALAGSRGEELRAAHARLSRDQRLAAGEADTICIHDGAFPRRLRFAACPRALHVAGGLARFEQLAGARVVAIAGAARASDYGVAVAGSLARGLAASGVTVSVGLADGIARAALAGSLEAGGRAVCVLPGGVGAPVAGRHAAAYGQLMRAGCAVSELPGSAPPRIGARAASERTVVGLADLTIVVEAEDRPRELAAAHLARVLGRPVAAVPGRVTSPLAVGTNSLLRSGAALVSGAEDALELLSSAQGPGAAAPDADRRTRVAGRERLEPRLRQVLARVGAGADTPAKLLGEGARLSDVLLALSELELKGLLARGDGARYVPREPLPRA